MACPIARFQEEWPEGYKLAAAMNFRFQQSQGVPLETIVNTISEDGMKLMVDMLKWNPEKRPTAANVRGAHPYQTDA